MATFRSVVLAQPEIASIIFGLQFGVYEDVASRFRAFNHLVDVRRAMDDDVSSSTYYALDIAFQTNYLARKDGSMTTCIDAKRLCLTKQLTRDARFPLHLAICEGDLVATQRIVACRPDLVYQEAIEAALMTGHLEIADFLLQTHAVDRSFDDETLGCVSRPLDAWLPAALLSTNNADALALLWRRRQLEWPGDVLRLASDAGAPQVIAFLYKHMPHTVYDGFVDVAASHGLLEIVIDLVARGFSCTADALDTAATNGHVDIVRFLMEQCHQVPSRTTMRNAANEGHLAVVKYLHELGTLDNAIKTAFGAAWYDHDDIVRYLVANRREGDCTLRFDAPVSDLVFIAAYLLSIGHTLEKIAVCFSTITRKRMSGVLEVVAFFSERGAVLDATWMIGACERGDMDVVVYLHDHGAASAPEAIDEAVWNEQWAIVDFLMAHRTEGATLIGIEFALVHSQFDLITRLWAKQPELRDDDLLRTALVSNVPDAVHFLLQAGVGKPREMLSLLAPRWSHPALLRVLLPYVLDAPTPIENLAHLVETFANVAHNISKSNLLVIKAEMLRQANDLVDASDDLQAHAATLLRRGAETTTERDDGMRVLDRAALFDWALAVLIVQFSTDAPTMAAQKTRLDAWMIMVDDPLLRSQLRTRLDEKGSV
ncbi:hypothetical protein SDRG_14508 [Saprolegnia diclina VS20]|uniref:Uncharacterized protein n=1 Tax=Saprolegnia diclina (strain VS20) TaxID=1156394 RepID=T0PQH6_SAPDV|nr:hypothetical protein SDRG_14508 [Saprolegnia diclina VS20]EQC27759.1 hypothetical protein SDRG_14508 [Saprolegnia diclina VS20]|eukprot:XP_008618864.1 hypothetical protein SDRG_14508 [Saprolegnia diclina VS20]